MFRRTDNATTAYRVRVTVVLASIAGMLLSWPVWTSGRDVPELPLLPFLPAMPTIVGWLMALGLLALLAVHLRRRPERRASMALGVLGAFMLLLDQTRWQPWTVQYTALLFVLLFLPSRREDGDASALDMARVLIAAMYVWSGIGNMNLAFWAGGWQWLARPLSGILPPAAGLLALGGIAVPFLLMLVGIGLLTVKYRKVAMWTAIAVQLGLIALFGNFGRGIQTAWWTWLEALVPLVFLLFRTERPVRVPVLAMPPRRFLTEKLIVLFFVVLPVLGLVGRWDPYLAMPLYAPNVAQGTVVLDRAAAARLSEGAWRHTAPKGDSVILDLGAWSLDENKVPFYPAPRTFKEVAKKLCAVVGEQGMTLHLSSPNGLFDVTRRVTDLPCDRL